MFEKKYSKVKNETTATNPSSSNEINENKCKFSRSACYILILGIIIILIISIIIVIYFTHENSKNNGSLTSNNNNNNNNASLYIFNTTNKSLPKNVWRNPNILEKENDPLRNIIYGKYMVFFNLKCMDEQESLNRDVIDEFLKLWKCYKLNENVKDEFPNIIDHWIYIENIDNCHQEDDVEIIWSDYCISAVEEDETGDLDSNTCLERSGLPGDSYRPFYNLWSSSDASGSYGLKKFQFVDYDPDYNPNMDIIVMDSGIDATHSQFTGVTIERIFDAYPGRELHFHGTAVASVLVGKDYGSFRADTDKLKVFDVRILDSTNHAATHMYLNGLDSIITHLNANPGKKYIINMSFRHGIMDQISQRLANIALNSGIMITSAGNRNRDAGSDAFASSPHTITVGATQISNFRWSKSNYGLSVDIWAPGEGITVALPGQNRGVKSGTSYASPLVSGIAANILANNPSLNMLDIKKRLLKYAIYDVDDRRGNTNLPRAQALCKEYCQDYGCIDGSEEVSGDDRTGRLGIEDGVTHFRQCEGATASYACPDGKELYLEECWYGRPANDSGNDICGHRAQEDCPVVRSCSPYIEGQCNNQNSCDITINNHNIGGDPCPNIYKYGGIAMRCFIPTRQVTGYEGAYNLGFVGLYKFTAFEICQNEQVTFSCNPGYLLSLHSCGYGSPVGDIGFNSLCPRNSISDRRNCPFQELSCRTYIEGQCNNQQSCTITINNGNMGRDPCPPSIKKFAFIKMKCIKR